MKTGTIGLAIIVALSALTGCQRKSDDGPTELNGRHFIFNYRVATATYLVNLAKKASIPDGSFAVGEFENPAGGAPLVVREKIFPFWDRITLQSPAVHCVRKDRPYAVSIRLIDANERTIQTIQTVVTSDVDQSILPAKPLVIGPGYTENPEMFRDGKMLDLVDPTKCPG